MATNSIRACFYSTRKSGNVLGVKTTGVVFGTKPIRAFTGQDYSIFYSDPSSAELDLFCVLLITLVRAYLFDWITS